MSHWKLHYIIRYTRIHKTLRKYLLELRMKKKKTCEKTGLNLRSLKSLGISNPKVIYFQPSWFHVRNFWSRYRRLFERPVRRQERGPTFGSDPVERGWNDLRDRLHKTPRPYIDDVRLRHIRDAPGTNVADFTEHASDKLVKRIRRSWQHALDRSSDFIIQSEQGKKLLTRLLIADSRGDSKKSSKIDHIFINNMHLYWRFRGE